MGPMDITPWQRITNALVGIKPEHKVQLVPHRNYAQLKDKIKDLNFPPLIRSFEDGVKKKGLIGLDIKKLKGAVWKTGDGTKVPIYRVRVGKFRILLCHIVDDPDSSSRRPVIYLHSVFLKTKANEYNKQVQRITKSKQKIEYDAEPIKGDEIIPTVVQGEGWKIKGTVPFVPTSDDEYESLKKLTMKSEMAVLPTMDQINAISQPKRPLFINGQAGTGKTTGMSWILSMLIPHNLLQKNGNRVLVTAMTKRVVEKLQTNTEVLLEARHNILEDLFDLSEGQIVNYVNASKDNKNEWYQKETLEEVGGETVKRNGDGPNLAFIEFKTILEDIVRISKTKIYSEIEYLDEFTKNRNQIVCSINFDLKNPTSVKNRVLTCRYCKEKPDFHHIWWERYSDDERTPITAIKNRLKQLRRQILNKNIGSKVSYTRFLIEFFGKRSFNIKPEFAWYGIRTLIKGYSVKNNYSDITQKQFHEKIPSAIASDFEGKLDDLYSCYDAYVEWLRNGNLRDEMDLTSDAAFLLEYFDGLIENKFNHLFLDEAQDLTNAEYIVMMALLKEGFEDDTVLAGDPLQTINPTGFDWDRLKDLMYEKLEIQPDNPQVLNHNWRAPKSIVNISNGILRLRDKFIQNETVEQQISHSEGPKPVLIYLKSDEGVTIVDKEILSDFLTLKSSYKVVTRQSDSRGVRDLLANDELINEETEVDNNLLTVTEIKGDEAENIVLYRTGEMKSDELNLLLKEKEDLTGLNHDTIIQLKFIVNQLYILATRSNEKMYIIETDQHKGRIWETLFAEHIEISKEPNSYLKNIMITVDANFDLNEYALDQLRMWSETYDPKFLRWAIERFESEIKKKGKLTPAQRNTHNRIKARLHESLEEWELAGDAWLKIDEKAKSFDDYVKAECWSKARNTEYKDANTFSSVLNWMEIRTLSNDKEMESLLGTIKKYFDPKNSIPVPQWFKLSGNELRQDLFDYVMKSKRKGDCKIEIPKWMLEGLDVGEVIETLEHLLEVKDFESLKEFIKYVESNFLIDTSQYEIPILENDLDTSDLYSDLQFETLIKLYLLVKPTSKKSENIWLNIAVNLLEMIDLPGAKVSGKMRTVVSKSNVVEHSEKWSKEFFNQAPSTKRGDEIRDLFFLLDLSNKQINNKFVNSIMFTWSQIKSKCFSTISPSYGSKTINYVSSEEFYDLCYKKITSLLLSATIKDLNSSKAIINAYIDFDWEVKSWGVTFGEKFAKEKNLKFSDNKLLGIWREWFCVELSKEDYTNVSLIVKLLIDSDENRWILESEAEKAGNDFLMEQIKMEKILLNHDSTDEEIKKAHVWFKNNMMNKKAAQALAKLPDDLNKEIEQSDNYDINEFCDLIDSVLVNTKNEEARISNCQKIENHKKRFTFHEKRNKEFIHKLNAELGSYSNPESDIFIFWKYFSSNQCSDLFKYYSNKNEITAKESRAVTIMANEIHQSLAQLKDVGHIYNDLLKTRWMEMNADGEWQELFAEAAMCSIVLDFLEKEMTKNQITTYSSDLISTTIDGNSTKKKMASSILNNYNSNFNVKVCSGFITEITNSL